MTTAMRLRIEPPPTFSGTKDEDFDRWAKRLKNYMSLNDTDYLSLMTYAETTTDVITMADLAERDTEAGETTKQTHTLYYILTGLVVGTAFVLIDEITDNNGLEAWRRLTTRYARTKTHTAIATLVSIVNAKFDDKNFETTFAKLESNITKLEQAI